VTIPIGVLGCWLGTVLSRPEAEGEHGYDELLLRSELGVGAEAGPERTGRFEREPVAEPVSS
jgi:hypothetical protein